MKTILTVLLSASFLVTPPMAGAEDDIRLERLVFPLTEEGTTTRGHISGYGSALYRLAANGGQRMKIALDASTNQTFFTVFAPGQEPGTEGLASSIVDGPYIPDINRFDGILPTTGRYQILVYQMRNAARKGLTSRYTLTVSISGEEDKERQYDYADGLASGPDFFAVATHGGRLNLRSAPSLDAKVIARLANGVTLQKKNCRITQGQRWCRVATVDGLVGWAAGEFLEEGTASAAMLPEANPLPAAAKTAPGER